MNPDREGPSDQTTELRETVDDDLNSNINNNNGDNDSENQPNPITMESEETSDANSSSGIALPSVLKRHRKYLNNLIHRNKKGLKSNDLSHLGLDISHVFFNKVHDGIVIDIDTAYVSSLNALVISTVGTDGIVKLWSIVPSSLQYTQQQKSTTLQSAKSRRRSISDKVVGFFKHKTKRQQSVNLSGNNNNEDNSSVHTALHRLNSSSTTTAAAGSDGSSSSSSERSEEEEKKETLPTRVCSDFRTCFVARFKQENTRFFAVQIDFSKDNRRQRVALASLNGLLTIYENDIRDNNKYESDLILLDLLKDHRQTKKTYKPSRWKCIHRVNLNQVWTSLSQSSIVSSTSFCFVNGNDHDYYYNDNDNDNEERKKQRKQDSTLLLTSENNTVLVYDYVTKQRIKQWRGSSDVYCMNPWVHFDTDHRIPKNLLAGHKAHNDHGSVLFTFIDVDIYDESEMQQHHSHPFEINEDDSVQRDINQLSIKQSRRTPNSRSVGHITVEQVTLDDQHTRDARMKKPLRIEYVLMQDIHHINDIHSTQIKFKSFFSNSGSKPIVEISPDGRTLIIVDSVVYIWCVLDYHNNIEEEYDEIEEHQGFRLIRRRCQLIRQKSISHYTSISISWIDNSTVIYGYNEIGTIFGTRFDLTNTEETFHILCHELNSLNHSMDLTRMILHYSGVNFTDFSLRSHVDRRIASMISLPLPLRCKKTQVHCHFHHNNEDHSQRQSSVKQECLSEWLKYQGLFVVGLWSATVDLFLFEPINSNNDMEEMSEETQLSCSNSSVITQSADH